MSVMTVDQVHSCGGMKNCLIIMITGPVLEHVMLMAVVEDMTPTLHRGLCSYLLITISFAFTRDKYLTSTIHIAPPSSIFSPRQIMALPRLNAPGDVCMDVLFCWSGNCTMCESVIVMLSSLVYSDSYSKMRQHNLNVTSI